MRKFRPLRQALLTTLLLWAVPPAPQAQTPTDTLSLVVMSTTDIHGWILPWDYYTDQPEPRYGLSKVATLVDSVRSRNPHTLLLDAGDWLQGNPMADYFATVDTLSRFPFLRAVDAMHYDAVVLGNHEFNFGIDLLNRRIAQTATPILGGNVLGHDSQEPAYVPYIIREVGGVRVGIVGLTTPGSAVWDRPRVEGRLDFADGVESAARWVGEARREGAEVVIILAHTGVDGVTSYADEGLGEENFGRAVAEAVPGVDLLVLGHAHRVIAATITGHGGREIGVMMPGRWGSHLGLAELRLVRDGDATVRVIDQSVRVLPAEHAESDPGLEALVNDAHEAVRAHMNQRLAMTPEPWPTREARVRPTAAIDLIHRVQLAATGARLSAAAAFSTSVTLGPDAITLGQISQLYPYQNMLYVVEISGAELRDYLEHTAQYYLSPEGPGEAPKVNPAWPGFNFDMIAGADYVLDLSRPVGERVVLLTVDDRDVQDGDVFTIAVNSYRAEGGGGFPGMGDARVIRRIDRSVRDLIADYLREKGTIRHEEVTYSNWSLSPRPE